MIIIAKREYLKKGEGLERVLLIIKEKNMKKLTRNQLLTQEEIAMAVEKEYSIEVLKLLKKCGLNDEQKREIEDGFEGGLNYYQVRMYADPNFSKEQMQVIKFAMLRRIPYSILKLICNNKFSPKQMKLIIKGYKIGCTEQQIKLYANPDFNYLDMEAIFVAISLRSSHVEIENLLKEATTSEERLRNIYEYVIKKYYPDLKVVLLSTELLSRYFNFIKVRLTLEQAKFILNGNFNEKQQAIIQDAFKNNLSIEEVVDFADPKLRWDKMMRKKTEFEIKKSLLNYLKREYEDDTKIEDFDKEYPDITNIGIAYGTTPDEKHEIQIALDMKNLCFSKYVDDTLIEIDDKISLNLTEDIWRTSDLVIQYHLELLSYEDSKEKNVIEHKEILDNIIWCDTAYSVIQDLKVKGYDEFIIVYEDDLYKALKLKIDDDGNYYEG